jgi:uroporphyrinogen-III decarboxylase
VVAGEVGTSATPRGHIFNLGHGILPDTPLSAAEELVRLVRDISGEIYPKDTEAV